MPAKSKIVSAGRPWAIDASQPHQMVSRSGFRLQRRTWRPKDHATPKAVVVFIHGAGEHSGRYHHLGERLAAEGCITYAHDHVGMGMSDGPRMKVDNFNTYIVDQEAEIREARLNHPDLPLFIIGNSMGGGIAVQNGLDNPSWYNGVVLIGPMVAKDPRTATPCKVGLANCCASACPGLPLGGFKPADSTRNKDEVKALKEDPHMFKGSLKAKWAVGALKTMDALQAQIQDITFPMLILHGEDDKLCNIDGSRMLAQSPSKDSTLKTFPDAYHDLLHEQPDVTAEALDTIAAWIAARINGPVYPSLPEVEKQQGEEQEQEQEDTAKATDETTVEATPDSGKVEVQQMIESSNDTAVVVEVDDTAGNASAEGGIYPNISISKLSRSESVI